MSPIKLENVVNTSKSPPAFQEINLYSYGNLREKTAKVNAPLPIKKIDKPLPSRERANNNI